MLVLVAEQSLVTGDEGQQIVAAQKRVLQSPQHWVDPMLDVTGWGGLRLLDYFKKRTTRLFLPTDWPSIGACEAAKAAT